MVERRPDFEDEKVRIWRVKSENPWAERCEGNPRVMSLDLGKEEIVETRTYRFRRSPEAFLYLVKLLASKRSERSVELELLEGAHAVVSLMENTTLKFLAKRRKIDGLISFLLIAMTPKARRVLGRHEWVEEDIYRKSVQDLETTFLSQRVLTRPQIVTLEEWRSYAQEGAFSDMYLRQSNTAQAE